MSNNTDLTDRQQTVKQFIEDHDGPVTYNDLMDGLDLTYSTARDHISDLRNAGVSLGEESIDGVKTFYLRSQRGEHPANPGQPTGDLRSKAAVTREAKEDVRELIQYLDRELQNSPPPVPDDGLTVRDSNEDMVVHRSDDHIGALYNDEFGDDTFNTEIATQRVRTVSERTFRLKRRQEEAGIEFDTLHVLLGGDHLHGTGIHEDQPWETEIPIPEQLSVAYDLYTEFIDQAAAEFPSVQIVCQRGNHGELRGNGMGPDDNVDDAFFMMLDKYVRDMEFDNVKLIESAAGNFTNFPLRGDSIHDCAHQGHLRHGQNSLEHIGTSAGKKRWYAWLRQHDFDIAYRGHYHEFKVDHIASQPVIESGSICPPSDYEESLAEWSEPAATVHGVSDDRPITWFYPVEFESPRQD